MAKIELDLAATRPLVGHRIGICLHLEPKTGRLIELLVSAGAQVVATGNLGTTNDETADFLDGLDNVTIVGRRTADPEVHATNLRAVLDSDPSLILLVDGNMVNLVIGRGDPIETVEIGLALQALTLAWLGNCPGSGTTRTGAAPRSRVRPTKYCSAQA